jgi:ABC-type polysaccharide/polyol phosphate transport system ATPase subunit
VTGAPLAPGAIELLDASRSFEIRGDHAGTLKGLLLGRGRRAAGPPPVPALRGVTLRIEPGETVGIVGRNGAGKTSTLRVLAGIVPLHAGSVRTAGRVVSLLELGAGFSRDFSGRENIYLQGALYGLRREQLAERIERIVDFSELGEFIDVPVKTYSTGMFVRLGFSIATHLDADAMLIDEVLAVGDEAFQRKCMRRISEQIAGGTTLVLVSHDPGAIERVCERVVVLDAGRVVFDGATAEGLLHYHRLMGTEHGGGESVRPRSDRAIDVTEVELSDGSGRRTNVFRTGEALRVEVAVAARRAVTQPRLSLEVRAHEGTRAFATATPLALDANGRATLQFEIPRLALLGGDYDLLLAAGDDAAGDRAVRFSVASAPGGDGIVDLRGTWSSVQRAEVAT